MKISNKMVNQPTACVYIILIYCVLWVACSFPVALSCDSCGRECASACGTRHFRTCCFNYLRKRSSAPPVTPPPPSAAPPSHGLPSSLEQWLAKFHLEQQQMEGLNNRHRPSIELESIFSSNKNPSSENEVDYELRDGGVHDLESNAAVKRNSIVASHSSSRHLGKFRRYRLDDDRDGPSESEQRAASEESDPGRLQLFYEA